MTPILRDNNGIPIPIPALDIARGSIPSASYINKFGRNADIDTGTDPEDIWDVGGLYAPPTESRIHNIVSTSIEDAGTVRSSGTVKEVSTTKIIDTSATFQTDSVAVHDIVLNDTTQDHSLVVSIDSQTQLTVHKMHHDTSNSVGDSYRIVTPAGDGAAVAHIKQGLDANFEMQTEFIVLNGTSNVATTKSYLRINRFHIHGVGSTKTNVGNVKATAATDGTITAQISAGNGQTMMAFFTIPAGKSGYITNINATLNKKGGSGVFADMALYQRLWADTSNGGDGELVFAYFALSTGGSYNRNYNPYLYVSEFSDIWLRCEGVSADNSDVSAGFDLILVDK